MEPSISLRSVGVQIPARRGSPSLKNVLVGRLRGESRPGATILSDVNLEIRAGERVGIVGRNGSGKTTLLKVIAGIFPPTSGTRQVVGRIAPIISQGLGFDGDLSLRQNIQLGLAMTDRLSDYTPEFEARILDFAELTDHADQAHGTLSSGMRSRLAFALSLFQEPDILLLDEVFATGDAGFVDKARDAMKDRIGRSPIVVLVTHSPDQVREVCTRAVLLIRGRVDADGAPADVLRRYEATIPARRARPGP